MKKALLLLSLLVLTVSLTACGGSSGSSSTPDTPVTPVSGTLSGAVVAGPIDGAGVFTSIDGVSTKIGVAEKGIIKFDKVAVAKIKAFPTVINTDGVGTNSKTKVAFDFELSAIMMSANEAVYVTPFSTIAAKIFAAKKTELGADAAAIKAKEMVKSIAKDSMGCATDPFANPVASDATLLSHEILTQSLLAAMDLHETDLTFGGATDKDTAVAFKNAMDALVVALNTTTFGDHVKANLGGASSVSIFLNANKAAIAKRVSATITELTAADSDAEKNADMLAVEREVTVPPVSEEVKIISFKAVASGQKYVAAEAATVVDVTVTAKNNKALNVTSGSKFVISKVPATGKLYLATDATKAALTAGTTEYTSGTVAQFKFAPVADKDADYTVEFATVVAEGKTSSKAEVTVLARKADTVIAKSIAIKTVGTSKKLLPLTKAGDLDVATIAKDAKRLFTTNELVSTVTFYDVSGTASAVEVNKVIAVRFTAPEGLGFALVGELPVQSIEVPVAGAIAGNVIDVAVPTTYTLMVTKTGGMDAGKLAFKVEVINKDAEPKVLFDTKSEIVVCAAGTENMVQAVKMGAEVAETDFANYTVVPGVALTKSAVVYYTTWNSKAAVTAAPGTAPAVAAGWFAYSDVATLTFPTNGVMTGATITDGADAYVGMYGCTLTATTVNAHDATLTDTQTRRVLFAYDADGLTTEDNATIVPAVKTTGGIVITQKDAAGTATAIALNGAAATATGANAATPTFDNTIVVHVDVTKTNTATAEALDVDGDWAAAVSATTGAPAVATTAVAITSVASITKVDDDTYSAVVTLAAPTINNENIGSSDVKLTFGGITSDKVAVVVNTAD